MKHLQLAGNSLFQNAISQEIFVKNQLDILLSMYSLGSFGLVCCPSTTRCSLKKMKLLNMYILPRKDAYTPDDLHRTWKWWFGRWLSFSRGVFSGSTLIFLGVDVLSQLCLPNIFSLKISTSRDMFIYPFFSTWACCHISRPHFAAKMMGTVKKKQLKDLRGKKWGNGWQMIHPFLVVFLRGWWWFINPLIYDGLMII